MVEDAAIAFVLETIRNLVVNESNFLGNVKSQAERLQEELERMQWFLKDADAKKADKERIRKWVTEFREIAYDAEDLLESYSSKICLQNNHRGGVMQSLRRCITSLGDGPQTHKVGLQLDALLAKISHLKESFGLYGVRDILEGKDEVGSTKRMLRRSYSHMVEEDFVGLNDDLESLVEHLVMGHHKVVSISGMGGLGKTTLARKIYNHQKVKSHFEASAWICISQDWRKSEILKSILLKIVSNGKDEIEKMSEDELVRKSYHAQKNRNCLVILDDIWETDAWESIKDSFQMSTKILLTTRNKEVALQISQHCWHHQPRLLSEEECWELLQKKAFLEHETEKDDITSAEDDFEDLGREMIKHCGGLPLAVILLGGVLASKHSVEQWRNVNGNIKHYLGNGKGTSSSQNQARAFEEILSLSYDDLPHRLKPCFLHMAAFQEDVSIDVDNLYHLWMAEGLVSMEDRVGEEELMICVAERYLGELAKRCMVQVKSRKILNILKFESCRLHDIIRDLSLRKAKEENFIHILSSNRVFDYANNTSNIRRLKLSIQSEETFKENYSRPLRRSILNHTRFFHLHVDRAIKLDILPWINSNLKYFKPIKVLIVEGLTSATKHEGGKLKTLLQAPDTFHTPNSIRYLSVRNSYNASVPLSVCKSEHLQTLDLCQLGKWIARSTLNKQRKLKYLYLPDGPNSFVFLPPKTLRLHKLKELEILRGFNPSFCYVKDLPNLTNLRELSVVLRNEELHHLTDVINGVNNLSYLRYLALFIFGFDNLEVDEIDDHWKTLIFSLTSNISKTPTNDSSIFLRSLNQLELYRFHIQDSLVEALENLPKLQYLFLVLCKGLTEFVCHSNGFPQLIHLRLQYMLGMKKWSVDEGAMPNLSFLKISACEKLEMFPEGLRSLKELQISRMPPEFVNRIRVVNGQEGADFHKVSFVPSVIIKEMYNNSLF